MKRLTPIFLIVIVPYWCIGQITTDDKNVYPTLNILNSSTYTIRAEKTGYNNFRYFLKKQSDDQKNEKSQDFSINPNVYESFGKSFYDAFVKIADKKDKSDSMAIVNEGRRLFMAYIMADKTVEELPEGPVAGWLYYNTGAAMANLKSVKEAKQRQLVGKEVTRELNKAKRNTNVKEEIKGNTPYFHRTGVFGLTKEYKSQSIPTNIWLSRKDMKKSLSDSLLKDFHKKNLQVYVERRKEYFTEQLKLSKLNDEIAALRTERKSQLDSIENMKSRLPNPELADSTRKGGREVLLAQIQTLTTSVNKLDSTLGRREINLIDTTAAFSSAAIGLNEAYEKIDAKLLTIKKIELEFNEGFIENIVVVGNYMDYVSHDKADVKFENLVPIGFSRKKDFSNLDNIKLYDTKSGSMNYVLSLNDVIINYVQKHAVDRRDFSPANQTITIDPKTEKNGFVVLRKDPTYKMFEGKVFSDFVGLDDTEPNGLIQTEIEKRINLITKKMEFRISRKRRVIWSVDVLGYVKPFVVISKLESTNKRLELSYKHLFINQLYAPQRYVSTLDLKRYENLSTGFQLNLASIDVTSAKSIFKLDAGLAYGRTAIADSLREVDETGTPGLSGFVNEYGVNTFQSSMQFIWQIKADERYSFETSYQMNWYFLRDNRFLQVSNDDTYHVNGDEGPYKYTFSRVEMLATLNTNPKSSGRLFFRYRYYWQLGFWNTGFHQAQIGYSFYLFGKDK